MNVYFMSYESLLLLIMFFEQKDDCRAAADCTHEFIYKYKIFC